MKEKIKVFNKNIIPISSKDEFIKSIINKKKILIAIQPRKIISKNTELTRIINENIGYPDGQGTVMSLAKKGVNSIKYPGYLLWLDIIENYHEKKSFYLIGATESVIQKTIRRLKNHYPKINIKNFRNGYIKEDEIEELKNDLKKRKPDVVFVAMGSPRQEFLMDKLIKIHPALYVGLGGSFDVYSGNIKAVPKWWEKTVRSEALYRIIQDPKKIKRQTKVFPFLYYYFTNKL